MVRCITGAGVKVLWVLRSQFLRSRVSWVKSLGSHGYLAHSSITGLRSLSHTSHTFPFGHNYSRSRDPAATCPTGHRLFGQFLQVTDNSSHEPQNHTNDMVMTEGARTASIACDQAHTSLSSATFTPSRGHRCHKGGITSSNLAFNQCGILS